LRVRQEGRRKIDSVESVGEIEKISEGERLYMLNNIRNMKNYP
jgi:hypothetical protein